MINRNKLIMGSAIGIAAIAVVIDHTRHRLPEPVSSDDTINDSGLMATDDENQEGPDISPCSLNISPCSL